MQTLYKLPEYYEDLVKPFANTNFEIDFLDEIFKKHNVKKVLDIACGVGRHAIPLSKRGYGVCGIDFSEQQIKKAKENANKEGSSAEFILGDANSFSYEETFDAAICMWTTIGEEPMKYWKVISNAFKSLKKGGIFIIDNKSWKNIPESREEIIVKEMISSNNEKIKTTIHNRYTENFRVMDIIYDINGTQYKDLCLTYILKEEDLIRELKKSGFTNFEIYHDYRAEAIKYPSHINIIARK